MWHFVHSSSSDKARVMVAVQAAAAAAAAATAAAAAAAVVTLFLPSLYHTQISPKSSRNPVAHVAGHGAETMAPLPSSFVRTIYPKGITANPQTENLDVGGFDSSRESKGWNSHAHSEFPRNVNSEILGLRIRSLRIDRAVSSHRFRGERGSRIPTSGPRARVRNPGSRPIRCPQAMEVEGVFVVCLIYVLPVVCVYIYIERER